MPYFFLYDAIFMYLVLFEVFQTKIISFDFFLAIITGKVIREKGFRDARKSKIWYERLEAFFAHTNDL